MACPFITVDKMRYVDEETLVYPIERRLAYFQSLIPFFTESSAPVNYFMPLDDINMFCHSIEEAFNLFNDYKYIQVFRQSGYTIAGLINLFCLGHIVKDVPSKIAIDRVWPDPLLGAPNTSLNLRTGTSHGVLLGGFTYHRICGHFGLMPILDEGLTEEALNDLYEGAPPQRHKDLWFYSGFHYHLILNKHTGQVIPTLDMELVGHG